MSALQEWALANLTLTKRSRSASASDSEDSVSSDGSLPPVLQAQDAPEIIREDRDFTWTLTEEPHRSRRMEIIRQHPEVSTVSLWQAQLPDEGLQVTKLMGHEPLTKYLVLLVVSIQLYTACALRHTSPASWHFILLSYVIGGTANQNLFLAIHEITHNLAFRGIRKNRLLAIFANLPIGLPYAMLFKVSFRT